MLIKFFFVAATAITLLPLSASAKCLRDIKVFPEGKGWLRYDADKQYTYWWKFQPPRLINGRMIGRVIETTSDSLEAKEPFARFVRYSHIEFDCARTNNERTYSRQTANSMKPDSVFTKDLSGWGLVEGNNIELYISLFFCT